MLIKLIKKKIEDNLKRWHEQWVWKMISELGGSVKGYQSGVAKFLYIEDVIK